MRGPWDRGGPGGEGGSFGTGASRARLEDLALLCLATLLLVLPAWMGQPLAPQTPGGFEPAALGVRARDDDGLGRLSIDVNRAPWHAWALLDGIGEARGRQIVAFREERGRFDSLDDLEEIPGLPASWLDQARPYLTLAQD